MSTASYGDRDPIAAQATPLAESALALIRTAGGKAGEDGQAVKSAIELVARVFSRPQKLLSAPGNSVVHGWITGPYPSRNKIDEVLVSVYRGPASYTGEDGADISCHGGIAAAKAVMDALKNAGFREALPGEFTFRAFMNGKLDLTRAESVMELVAAKTHKGREQALRRLAGVLQKEISSIKEELVTVLAGTEIYLDYSEDEFFGSPADSDEGDEEVGRLPERALAEDAAKRLKILADLWRRERIYAEGALAVIAGRPNAGKSSLFNYLLREDRSIVTDVPGTTRDWIEALISVEGIPLSLADTAGLRNPDDGDEAERIGIERSLELLDRADLVIYLIDGVRGITREDREFLDRRGEAAAKIPPAVKAPPAAKIPPLIVLWNKADIAPEPLPDDGEFRGKILPVSAKTGEGIPELLRSAADLLAGASPGSSPGMESAAGPGTVRQKDLIESALASVEEALALADRGEVLDIIAPLFRSAVNALGEITGEVSGADILEAMFSRFCVGK